MGHQRVSKTPLLAIGIALDYTLIRSLKHLTSLANY